MTLVCTECFGDKGLRKRIVEVRPAFPNEKCDFHPTFKGIPVESVAQIVDVVFRNNYGIGYYNPILDDIGGRSLEEVIYDLTGADLHPVVVALVDALIEGDSYWPPDGEKPFYQQEVGYERTDYAFFGHSLLWAEFERSIVHDQRFFNDKAKGLLTDIFDDIHRQRDTGRRQPIVVVEPGSPEAVLLRARLANDEAARKAMAGDPSLHLGPPPQRKRRPGRMNSSGIQAFYAAYDLPTCIAELRPRVGSIVASAEFEITKPLVALDTTKFAGEAKEPNLFAKDHVKRMAQWRFMQSFMHEISQPISPDDEHLDYIPTQAVAEYLLRHHKLHLNGEKRPIEAVIFRSAQHPTGKNIVILGDASTVESPPHPKLQRRGSGTPFDPLEGIGYSTLRYTSGSKLRLRPGTFKLHRISGAEFRPTPFEELPEFDPEDF